MMRWLLVFVCSASCLLAASDDVERRAALDIGSGQVKIQVADVDLKVNRIAKVLFTDFARVPLREDLNKSLDGRLSIDIQNQIVNAVVDLMKKASQYHPVACHAVATESLRMAKNGQEVIERIGQEAKVPVTIISQEEEGVLGFLSAVHEANVDPSKAISWDFGGGSFQITAKEGDSYAVYKGRLGKVPMKNALVKIQGKDVEKNPSANPIAQSDADQALLFIKSSIQDVPEAIREKIQCADTIILGVGINPLWGLSQSDLFDDRRIKKELDSRLNLDDEGVVLKDAILNEYAPYRVSNILLAYGIMQALHIQTVQYVGTQGANSVGLLLSQNYWPTIPKQPEESVLNRAKALGLDDRN